MGDPGSITVRCACGWEASGSEEEVVAATVEHGRRLHNMVPSRDAVLAMVVRAPTAPKPDVSAVEDPLVERDRADPQALDRSGPG